MRTLLIKITMTLLFISATFPQNSEAEIKQRCVPDRQVPDDVVQTALKWACKQGGSNYLLIQPEQPCFLPDTIKDHASVVFNNYYQQNKHKGGYCYFNASGMITHDDPSHGSCHFDYIPDSKESAKIK